VTYLLTLSSNIFYVHSFKQLRTHCFHLQGTSVTCVWKNGREHGIRALSKQINSDTYKVCIVRADTKGGRKGRNIGGKD
jgi:hypothetical protein